MRNLASGLGVSGATIYRCCSWAQIDAVDIVGVNSAMASALADVERLSRGVEEGLTAIQMAASMLNDDGIRLKGGSRSSKLGPGRALASAPSGESFVSPVADIGPGVTGRWAKERFPTKCSLIRLSRFTVLFEAVTGFDESMLSL